MHLWEFEPGGILIGPTWLVVPASRAIRNKFFKIKSSTHDDGVLAKVVYGERDVLQSDLKQHCLGERERALLYVPVHELVVVVDENYFVYLPVDGEFESCDPLRKPGVTLGAPKRVRANVIPRISGYVDSDEPEPQVICASVLHMKLGHGIKHRLFFGGGEIVSVALDVLKRLPAKGREDGPFLVRNEVVVVSHHLFPL